MSVKVLIIEDHEGVRQMIRTWLEAMDYEVSEAYDGPSGVMAAKTIMPDLIICDLAMPGMSGIEVMETLRADLGDKTPPLVVVTANFEKAPAKTIELLGVREMFPKPIPFKELQKKLRQIIDEQQQNKQ